MNATSAGSLLASVTTEGLGREELLGLLVSKGFDVGTNARIILRRAVHIPRAGEKYDVFSRMGSLDETVLPLPLEAAVLLRTVVTDDQLKEMGYKFLVLMHEPVRIYPDSLWRLCIPLDTTNRLIGWANPGEYGLAYRV